MKKRINGNSHQLAANEALVKLSENLDCEIIIHPEMINLGEKLNETKDKDENSSDIQKKEPLITDKKNQQAI